MRWILIDQILECEPGVHATGVKTFPRSDTFFMDHFPGMPIVPGVLQIEMMAQMSGKCFTLKNTDQHLLLGSVKNAKFYHSITPGDRCIVKAKVLKSSSSYVLSEGSVTVDDKVVSRAEILFGVIPRSKFNSSYVDTVSNDWLKQREQK